MNDSEDDSEGANPRTLGIKDYLGVIRERWILGAATGLLLAGVFSLYALSRTPEYTSAVQLLVALSRDNVLKMEQVVDDAEIARSPKADSLLKQHLIEIQSRKFTDYLVSSLNHDETERILKPYRSREFADRRIHDLLQNSLAVYFNARDMVYTISATHRDPRVAAEIANLYALKYIEYTLSDVGSSNASALTFLRQNAEKLHRSSLEDKQALQRFRNEHGIISVQESRDLVIGKIVSLNANRSEMVSEKSKHEVVLDQLRRRGVDADGLADDRIGAFLEIEEIGSFGNIRKIKIDLDSALQLQKEIDLVYLERHPKFIENQERINDLRARLRGEISLAFNSLLASVAKLDARIAKNTADIGALEAEIQRLDELGIIYRGLETKIANDETTLKQIEGRLNETVISTQLSKANMRVIDPAAEPSIPSSPNRKRVLMTAIFLFILGVVGLPIGLNAFDDKVKSVGDVEDGIGKPLLGEVMALTKEQAANLPYLASGGQNPSIVDAFRSIYNTVKLTTPLMTRKIQLVTSTIPDEGKTMFCMNYASVIAQHGKRVLLMECDLRKPQLQQYLGLQGRGSLVGWFIAGATLPTTADLHETLGIQQLESGVFLLPAGNATKRSTELVESDRFRDLIGRLSETFDHIIIDSPPLGLFPDAMFLADYAQEVIYVVRHNKVSRQAVKAFIERLDQTAANVCGIVINRRTLRRGHGGYYGYGYGYAKYYKKYYAGASGSDGESGARRAAKRSTTGQDLTC